MEPVNNHNEGDVADGLPSGVGIFRPFHHVADRVAEPRASTVVLVGFSPLLMDGLKFILKNERWMRSLYEVNAGDLADHRNREMLAESLREAESVIWLIEFKIRSDFDAFAFVEAMKQLGRRSGTVLIVDSSDSLAVELASQIQVGAIVATTDSEMVIRQSIASIRTGGIFRSEKFMNALGMGAHRKSVLSKGLSPRELSVLLGIAAGRSNSEMAFDLKLSPKTISTYRRRMMEKLQLSSDADIVRLGVEIFPHLQDKTIEQ